VAVGVGVCVGADVGVGVEVELAVAVGVFVGVGVTVGVGVGAGLKITRLSKYVIDSLVVLTCTCPVHTPDQPVRIVCHTAGCTVAWTGSAVPAITELHVSVTSELEGEVLNASSCASCCGDEKEKLPVLVWNPAKDTALEVSTFENGAWLDGYTYHWPICQNTRPLLS